MKTILFYSRSLQCKFYYLIGSKLKNNYKIIYLVQNNKEEELLIKFGCKCKIYNIQKYFNKNWNNTELLKSINLNFIESNLNISSLWQIFYTDRFLVEFNLNDALKLIKLHVSLFSEIFSKENPRLFVNEEIAIFSSYLMYFFCKKYSSKYLGLSNPRQIGDKKTAFVKDFKNNFYLLDLLYVQNNFSNNELKEAEQFISNFRSKALIPPYMLSGTFSKIKPSLYKSIYFLLQYLYHSLKAHDKADYMLYYQKNIHLQRSFSYFKYKLQRKYYQKSIDDEKYYLFPLHFQPEASTLVAAPNYEKQLFAMDLISKKIPVGSVLYVKEHYSLLGHREMSFYKSLKKYPNVRLINPHEDNHRLIKNSLGVITLTGTAGWEAILYSVPVFVLGNVFYRSFRYTNVVDNINDLSHIIKNHKTKNISEKEYKIELVKYVSSYLHSSIDGVSYLNSQDLHDDENINKISLAISNELK